MNFNLVLCSKLVGLLVVGALTLPATPGCAAEKTDGTTGNLEPEKGTAAPKKPTNSALKEVKDVPGLPRVLLIGDSVSMGYTLPVRRKLEGRANVHRALENSGATERGLTNLDTWLGDKKWDVIHFNFGLHDLKYLDKDGNYVSPSKGTVVATPEQYADNLRTIVERLKKTGAKLIFATTTPVPGGTLGRIRGDERQYNAVALKVMKDEGVDIDDLGGWVENIQDKLGPFPPKPKKKPYPQRAGDPQLPYNVHFTKEGYDQLADLVVASIVKDLPAQK